jgi:hypothetical protein
VDLVHFIESQIANISLTEIFAIAHYLGVERGVVGNRNISRVMISPLNQELSYGDSWFKVQWFEGTTAHSIDLHLEPGKHLCTAHDMGQQSEEECLHRIAPLTDDIDVSTQHEYSMEKVVDLFSSAAAIHATNQADDIRR